MIRIRSPAQNAPSASGLSLAFMRSVTERAVTRRASPEGRRTARPLSTTATRTESRDDVKEAGLTWPALIAPLSDRHDRSAFDSVEGIGRGRSGEPVGWNHEPSRQHANQPGAASALNRQGRTHRVEGFRESLPASVDKDKMPRRRIRVVFPGASPWRVQGTPAGIDRCETSPRAGGVKGGGAAERSEACP
jgi:hypothetical protein